MTKKEIQEELMDMGIYWTRSGSIEELEKAELFQLLCVVKNNAVLTEIRNTAHKIVKNCG